MNIENIMAGVIAGVLTGAITGMIIGYFGVQLAFKQFREQRAIDRQVEWYEKAIRALGDFSRLTLEMMMCGKISTARSGMGERSGCFAGMPRRGYVAC